MVASRPSLPAMVLGLSLLLGLLPDPAPAAEDARTARPSALIELDGSASQDPDGDMLLYFWKQVGGPDVVLSDPNAAKPYFRTSRPGRYLFELSVSDGDVRSKPALVEVLVERENLPPQASVPAEAEGVAGTRISIDGRKSRDADGDNLSYAWRQVSGPPLYLDETHRNQPVLTLQPEKAGVYQLELVVSDGRLLSKPARCRLLIKPRNRAPIAHIKAPTSALIERSAVDMQSVLSADAPVAHINKPAHAHTDREVTLDGRGSVSPNDKPLRYYWKQLSGPFVRTFDRNEEGLLRFTPEEPGTYSFELVVADREAESEPFVRSLAVTRGNTAPIAAIKAPTCATTGSLVRLDGSHSYDKEGSGLKYHWRQTDGPRVRHYSMDRALGDAAPGFIPTDPGTYAFELVVSDGSKKSRPAVARVRVEEPNKVPRAHVAGHLTVAPGEVAVLQAAGSDPEGDPLIYTWHQVAGPPLLTKPARQQALTLTPTEEGTYAFEVVASDGTHESRPARSTVTVSRRHADEAALAEADLSSVPPVRAAEMLTRTDQTPPPASNPEAEASYGIKRFMQRFVKPFKSEGAKRRKTPDDIAAAAPYRPELDP